MYLLDNNKNYNKSILKKIVEAENKEGLIESFYSKENNSLDLFFNKIDFCMKHINYKTNSRSLKSNILNLFKNEPLSLDANSLKEIEEKLNKFNKKNPLTKEIISKEFLSLYKDYLKEVIPNQEKNAYDIVGNVTRNLNKIFYGNKIINKLDMDVLLLHVKEEKEVSFKNINFEDRDNRIKEESFKIRFMANDLNLPLSNKIEEPNYYINKVSNFISTQQTKINNKYLDLKYKVRKELVQYYKTIINFETFKSNVLNLVTDQEARNHIQIANSIKDINVEKIVKKESNKELDNLKKDFQKINKELISLNENSLINTLYEKKISREITKKKSNKPVYIQDYIKNKENGFELLNQHLKSYINNDKYSLNELKEFLILNIAKNHEIYKLSSNSTIFSNIESNKVIKDYLNKNSDTRMEYVYQILKNKTNIEKLFTTDININIKDKFYNKLGLTIEDEISKYKLNELYKIFQEKQDSLNYKNSNILLGIVLEAYENKKFNNEKFEKLFNIVKTPINKLTNEDKDLVNQIDDKWIKWSICFNREIKDKSLIYSSINPLNFDYSKFKTIDKIFKEIYGENKNMSKLEVGIYSFIFDEKTEIEAFKKYIKNYNELVNKFMNNKSIKNQNLIKFLNLVDNSISLINKSDLSNKNVEKIINNIKNDLLDKSKFSKAYDRLIDFPSISSFINNVAKNMEDIDIEKILPTIIYIKSLKDKELQKSILNNKDVFNLFLENPYLQKISDKKIKGYMEYYDKMSQSTTFKNYREDDSLIPIISKDIGEGYSYKVKTIKDFDILLTGEKTHYCMRLGSVGLNIYKYMYENPKENVIFEVYKDGKPVANSWTWIKDNRVCFNNIKVLGNELRENIIRAYQDASLEFIVNHGIEETTFGIKHSNIDLNMLGNYIKSNIPNKHLNCYNDSGEQMGILSINNNVINKEESLSKINKFNKDNELFEKYKTILTKEKKVESSTRDKIDDLLNYTKLFIENNNNNSEEFGFPLCSD